MDVLTTIKKERKLIFVYHLVLSEEEDIDLNFSARPSVLGGFFVLCTQEKNQRRVPPRIVNSLNSLGYDLAPGWEGSGDSEDEHHEVQYKI